MRLLTVNVYDLVRKSIIRLHYEGFMKLPAYITNLHTTNPTVHVHLSIDSETQQFQRVVICSSESRDSFRFCRHFIVVDGTFLKSRFRQTLLLAVTIGANRNN